MNDNSCDNACREIILKGGFDNDKFTNGNDDDDDDDDFLSFAMFMLLFIVDETKPTLFSIFKTCSASVFASRP